MLPFDTCRWKVEDGDVEVLHEVQVRHLLFLTSRPLLRLLGVTAVAIVQDSVAGSQGDLSNLQRFKSHHPPTFIRRGDPMVADHWFRQIEKVLEAMDINFDATKIRLTAFQLDGESQVWWDWVKTSQDIEAMA